MSHVAKLLLILALAILGVVSVMGQEEECSSSVYLDILTEALPTFESAADQTSTTSAALLLSQRLQKVASKCGDNSYTSDEMGLNSIIGPVDISTGFYRYEAEFSDYFNLDAVEIDASCIGGSSSLVFDTSGGSDNGILEIREDCTLFFEIDADDDWTFSLEPLLSN
ncbi:hypothetical protein G4Y79_15390 [Phototrophicus methaneseepsis]|uniref:Uncharacterized protein n=1 Tax=Phototrophicus methaneseepsis TaxID=2710758 RepID=A0A7S8ID16_9CHLR|nr:hypothetical protein [Phototrophicus methaneseepsis]QPC81087.1 hypothetical protein G4Y79_15390 [Phototrophicus methaneseepsis]